MLQTLQAPLAYCVERWYGGDRVALLPQNDTRPRGLTGGGGQRKIVSTIKIKVVDADGGWDGGVEEVYNTWGCKLAKISLGWWEDENFGRGIVVGVLPELLEPTTMLPEQFLKEATFDPDPISGLLTHHDSLQEALNDNVLYVAATKKGKNCLFYAESPVRLVPVLLHDPETGVHSPNDNIYSWNIATLRFRQDRLVEKFLAEKGSVLHSLKVVSNAVNSCLSSKHPVRQGLGAFLENCEQAYVEFTGLFLQSDCVLSDVLPNFQDRLETYELGKTAFNFTSTRPASNTASSSLAQPAVEDAVLIWNAIEKYARNIVDLYYTRPTDLTADCEINNFVAMLRRHIHGVPYLRDYTTEPLAFIVGNIMWLCSGWQSLWRGDFYENLSYVLWSPLSLNPFTPPPKPDTTNQTLISLLPPPRVCRTQLNLVNEMCRVHEALPGVGDNRVVSPDPKAQACYEEFKVSLEDVEKIIVERNNIRELPYMGLLPSGIKVTPAV